MQPLHPHHDNMLRARTALVTGSTSGIGLGIARSLAARGANIVINGFGEKKDLDKLVSELEHEYKVKVHLDTSDLSKVSQIEGMMKKYEDKLDIVVNNAGIQYTSPVDSFPVEKWDAIMAINLSAVFHTSRLALPSMKKKNWGRIVNIASVHGLVASVNKSAYGK